MDSLPAFALAHEVEKHLEGVLLRVVPLKDGPRDDVQDVAEVGRALDRRALAEAHLPQAQAAGEGLAVDAAGWVPPTHVCAGVAPTLGCTNLRHQTRNTKSGLAGTTVNGWSSGTTPTMATQRLCKSSRSCANLAVFSGVEYSCSMKAQTSANSRVWVAVSLPSLALMSCMSHVCIWSTGSVAATI